MSTARERLERIQVEDGRGRYRGRSLVHEHDWQWLLRIAEAAIEAHEQRAFAQARGLMFSRVPAYTETIVNLGKVVVAIEDTEDGV